MSQTTPDIRQLSTCCGKPLVWRQNNPGGWHARCCDRDYHSRPLDGVAFRKPTATEDLLLARISDLEEARRWHVAAGVQLVEDKHGLLARIAELEATLANERGEGEPPVVGWEYLPRMGRWQAPHGVVARLPTERVQNEGWKAPYAWERWDTPEVQRGCADTFRAGMRAASLSQGADVPKGE